MPGKIETYYVRTSGMQRGGANGATAPGIQDRGASNE